MTDSACQWARDGISVLTLAPGYIETDLNREFLADPDRRRALESRIPVGHVGLVPDVARIVRAVFDSRVGFLTGTTIYLDGAQGVSL